MAAEILIVDDEADIRDLVAGILQDEGYTTRTARNSDEALAAVLARRPGLIFLDIWLQGSRLDGLQLLEALKTEHPELPVVMISGHGNIDSARMTLSKSRSRLTGLCWWPTGRWKIPDSSVRSNNSSSLRLSLRP